MTEEMLTEVDKNNTVLGLKPRSHFKDANHFNRASYLILFNTKGEIILEKRSTKKKLYPGKLTFTVAGHVSDETYEQCIQREMQEELQIDIPVKKLFMFKFSNEINKGFYTVFSGITDSKLHPDPKEISELVCFEPSLLEQEIKEHPEKFSPPFLKGIKIYFKDWHHKNN
jgi:isopentenyldiphosphate isomerase